MWQLAPVPLLVTLLAYSCGLAELKDEISDSFMGFFTVVNCQRI